MNGRLLNAQSVRDAGALRFLLLLLAGWAGLRALLLWNPLGSAAPAVAEQALPPVVAASARGEAPMRLTRMLDLPGPGGIAAPGRGAAPARTPRRWQVIRTEGARDGGTEESGGDRHPLLPQPTDPRAAPVAMGVLQSPSTASAAHPPLGMQRSLAGWSFGGWLYLRQGSGAAPRGIAAAGQLGGSQSGLRLAYGFGDSGRARVYGRGTVAIERPSQSEAAFGVAFAPTMRLPVDIVVEQRVAVGRQGRTALAAMLVGGVGDLALPGGFRLDAYAQAGIVGARRRDGFADGAVVVDTMVGSGDGASLRLGALAAAAVQPGTARVDVGPRVTLKLPRVGRGSRIALDWRQRIAGDAQPESGLALTLAADF